MEASKIYAKGIGIKEFDAKFGKIIKLGINVDKFFEFCDKNKNEKGYVNIDIFKMKETDKYGNTHYAALNTYKADKETENDPF